MGWALIAVVAVMGGIITVLKSYEFYEFYQRHSGNRAKQRWQDLNANARHMEALREKERQESARPGAVSISSAEEAGAVSFPREGGRLSAAKTGAKSKP